jgi:hypothetical protein
MEQVKREIFCEDAILWLQQNHDFAPASLVASLPDISEFTGYSVAKWKSWFEQTAELVFQKTSVNGVTIFYQSDIKREGAWVDKAYLCQKVAEKLGHELLWHKIICRNLPGSISFGRPSYSHILCFSKNLRLDMAKSTADVMPEMGEKTWERGMGAKATAMIAKFIAEQTETKLVINPFCGEGSMLLAANKWGLNAIGIERSPKRAATAKDLQ